MLTQSKFRSNSCHHHTAINSRHINYQTCSQQPTYSELKIILDNIHKIKIQAQNQIKSLQTQNKQLKSQKQSLLRILQSYVQKESEGSIHNKCLDHEQQLQAYKKQITNLSQTTTRYELQLAKVQSSRKYLEQQLNKQLKIMKNKEESIEKYQQLSKRLGIKYQQTNKEISYVLSNFNSLPNFINQYKNILQLNQQQQKNLFQKDKTIKIKSQSIISLQNTRQGLNKELLRYKQINTELQNNLKIFVKDIQFDKYTLEQNNQNVKAALMKLERQKKQKMTQLQTSKSQLQQKLENILHDMKEQQCKNRQLKMKTQYQKVVQKICQESKIKDYQRVLTRLQYLQKYRSEYYYNVEKIQYLCKMLDI